MAPRITGRPQRMVEMERDLDLVGTDLTRDDPAMPGRGGRRWPLALAVVAGLVAIGALGAAGVSYQRGTEWKERSEARDQRLADLEQALQRSEREVEQLTEQIDGLVAARTLAEGERDGALLAAEQTAELARISALVAEDLEACVDGTEALIGIFGDILAYDVSESSDFAGEVGRVCARARTSNRTLQELIADL